MHVSIDVYNSFLQGDLDEEVYMEFPDRFKEEGSHKDCRLRKPLYVLKQASRKWNILLTITLIKAGFSQSTYDYSLLTLKKPEGMIVILVNMDDLLVTGNNDSMISEAKGILYQQFKHKDLRELKHFLGIEVVMSTY